MAGAKGPDIMAGAARLKSCLDTKQKRPDAQLGRFSTQFLDCRSGFAECLSHRATQSGFELLDTPPLSQRLGRERVIRLEITLEALKVPRADMVIDGRLAGELLVKHEFGRILRI